jgi:hypothetical protein
VRLGTSSTLSTPSSHKTMPNGTRVYFILGTESGTVVGREGHKVLVQVDHRVLAVERWKVQEVACD